jgi:hypothetical protein
MTRRQCRLTTGGPAGAPGGLGTAKEHGWMSPEEGADPEHGSTGDRRSRPVIGSDGAAAPIAGELVPPGAAAGSRWAWDGEALPVPVERSGPIVPPQRVEADDGATAAVRPYVVTRGRTRANLELSLETLVSTLPKVVPYQLPHDEAAVLDLCRAQSRSVAEVAALHRVPIGVAKVLIADLATAGLLAVHRSFAASGPDLALMERVLGGLRRI